MVTKPPAWNTISPPSAWLEPSHPSGGSSNIAPGEGLTTGSEVGPLAVLTQDSLLFSISLPLL